MWATISILFTNAEITVFASETDILMVEAEERFSIEEIEQEEICIAVYLQDAVGILEVIPPRLIWMMKLW